MPFFGSIIGADKDNLSRHTTGNSYDLIDGQQRITSFLLLLKFYSYCN